MGSFFAYALQSAIYLAIFYLFYKVLLSRETFHRFNRIALLSTLALSLIIPIVLACHASGLFQTASADASPIANIETERLFIEETLPAAYAESGNRYLAGLLFIYLAGCTVCLIQSAVSMARIFRIINNGKCISNENGIRTMISDNKKISPFSWMNYIVLSQSDYDETGGTIIAHEKAHIGLHHTYDLFISQVCIILQWFNPAAWLLYREIQNIHEYEADEQVIRQGINARQYQLLLIKKAVGTRLYSMANSFNHSNLKKRITMMLQKKSSSWARLKYTYVLPLAATTLVVFARPEISTQFDAISNAKISHLALETSINEVKNPFAAGIPDIVSAIPEREAAATTVFQDPDSVYNTAEYLPEFPGGETALLKYIADQIVYPKEAFEKGIQGRVPCTFTVNKDGSISDIQIVKTQNATGNAAPGIQRTEDPLLVKEAIRVIKTLPKFKPGSIDGKIVRVRYSLPINFRLTPTQDAVAKPAKTNQADDPDLVYTTAEIMPQFPGGEVALLKYIADQIKYPKEAAEKGIQGRVSCTFIVNKDGSVSDVQITRPLNALLNNEAIRVIKTLPEFKPGSIDGKTVRVRYSLPVNFKIPVKKAESAN